MKNILLASVAVLALAGSTAVYAQHRGFDGLGRQHHHARMNPEDRAAFMDARIAAVKAGVKLTPEQDKMWPPLEAAVRDFGKLRIDRANARMEARKDERQEDRQESRKDDRDAKRDDRSDQRNPVERLRERADRMGETAAALKKIADAADPLYKTLDDGQKRRLAVLTRMDGQGGRHGGWQRGSERGMERFDRGDDRDDRGSRRERNRDAGPDRL
jgi:hypothetical protein